MPMAKQPTTRSIARRGQVAELLGAQPDEIVFTGGGTEASNLALKGLMFQDLSGLRGAGIVTSAVEHPATLQPCEFLKRLGCKITVVPVDKFGLVDPGAVRHAIDASTKIVSIMHANNEVGTIQPIAEIAVIARERGVMVHTDAAQSLGKVRVDVEELGVDLLTLAGHKVYAPKGIGVLYIRRGVKLEPLIHGAGHESGRRAGTENVAFIVGLGKACDVAHRSLQMAMPRLQSLRERLSQTPRRPGRPGGVKRPSGDAIAKHTERQLCRTHWRGVVAKDSGNRGVDWLGMP